MDHRDADRIMEQVEQYYRGDFLVNGDRDYSRLLAKSYNTLCTTRFNGSNGHFTAKDMFCTPGCEREGSAYRVPPGGVVYGPYYAFTSGDYVAYFELEGDLSKCTVSVFDGRVGTIIDGRAEELKEDGKVVLRFSLSEGFAGLELKTLNEGDGDITFLGVHVNGCTAEEEKKVSEPVAEAEDKTASEPVAEKEERSVQAAAWSARWRELQVMAVGFRDLQEAAECSLPKESRYRGIKLFFRKLLNSYITFQLEFNRKLIGALWAQSSQIQAIARTMAEQVDDCSAANVGELIAEMRELRRKTEEQEKRLREQQEQIDKLTAFYRDRQER